MERTVNHGWAEEDEEGRKGNTLCGMILAALLSLPLWALIWAVLR